MSAILFRHVRRILVQGSLQKSTITSKHSLCCTIPTRCLSSTGASLGGSSGTLLNTQRWQTRPPLFCAAAAFRHNSSDAATTQVDVPPGYIPDLPPLPEPAKQVVEVLNALGEPTLSSVGLGSYYPSGLFQQALELVHVGLDIPWWGAIVAATVCLRLAIFPLVILGQRNAAAMHNHMPTVQRLQERFTKARMSGNPLEGAKAGSELMDYMKRNKVNPMKNMMVPLAQMPIFISVFIGLRQMANLPVASMTTGGLAWFTDLTIPDPYYIMPLLTMGTFLATIEIGVDGVKAGTMSHNMKYVMRAMPFIMLPFIINFPSAMLCYWMASNSFSLMQVLFLKIPAIRTFFKIPELVQHPQSAQPKKKKFVEGFQESYKNSKIMAQVEDRQRMEALRFKEAGQGPIQRTYSYDPTKVTPKQAVQQKAN